MVLKKCPRCELNYILDGGALCSICEEEVHGRAPRESRAHLCSLCGVRPALPGQEMCADCRADLRSIEMTATGAEEEALPAIDEGLLAGMADIDDEEDAADDDRLPEEDTADEPEPPAPYRKAQ